MEAETKFRQDLPPSGGYRKFNFHRTFPRVLWKPHLIILGVGAFNCWAIFDTLHKKKLMKLEKFEDVDLTNALEPFYKAERDRNYLKFVRKNRELEEEVMKNVPGWVVGTYYGEPVYYTIGDRWMDLDPREAFAHSWYDQFSKDHMFFNRHDYGKPMFWDKFLPDIVLRYCN